MNMYQIIVIYLVICTLNAFLCKDDSFVPATKFGMWWEKSIIKYIIPIDITIVFFWHVIIVAVFGIIYTSPAWIAYLIYRLGEL